jgi:hypothetical protein
MSEPTNLTDWQKLGTVTTANGMFAIVAPYYATTLGKYWNEHYLPNLQRQRAGEIPDG